MKNFIVTWSETVQRCVVIAAVSADCALEKWKHGIDYSSDDVQEIDSEEKFNVEVEEE